MKDRKEKKAKVKEDCANIRKKLNKCDALKMCENQIRELNAATSQLEADCAESCWCCRH